MRRHKFGALGRLIAVAEAYPDLKSNQNFLALQSQLEGTENRIAVARRDYIEAERLYNTRIDALRMHQTPSLFAFVRRPALSPLVTGRRSTPLPGSPSRSG